MAGHEILAVLLHAEEKVPADSHYLYTHSRSLGTLMGEWGCRVTSLCSEWFGATERYWDKFLRVFFFCLVLFTFVSLKIWAFLLESTGVVGLLLVAPVRDGTTGILC